MRIAIAGASGKMGQTLIEALNAQTELTFAAAFDHADAALAGRAVAPGVVVGTDATAAIAQATCLIDFTRPQASLAHLACAVDCGCAMVIGTTGFDDAGKAAIDKAAGRIPIVFAPNMSVGVNAVFRLLDQAARMLADGYDMEVLEMHHRHKVDAPSGTALHMGEILARARGTTLAQSAVYAREGHTGARVPGSIGFATLRGGDVVGDHSVIFAGEGERIEIAHKSSSRMSYAVGALRAARFLAGKRSGLFDMQDVLAQ